ncbi:MAG: hypothetical protein CCU26_05705 [Nitrospira sp. UW-LDO-01]|nr:MAG: hypothetical protein CCU26_05705 [Nitrospira sp. UW-LDO-01]
MYIRLVAVVGILVVACNAYAVDLSGFAAMDLRIFTEQSGLPGQNPGVVDPTVFMQPEIRQEWSNGSHRATLIPFGRYDSLDSRRSHADLREANWLYKGNGWNIQAGVGKVFWGVTESRHLIDIVNQTDEIESIRGEDKLGQPMVNLNVSTRYGNLNLLYLPYFRERTYPSGKGRLRFELPVDTDQAQIQHASNWHPDWAVRWSHTFGRWDVGLAYFSGISREPRLVPNSLLRPTALIPVYELINQVSVDIQGAVGKWLLKLEAMTRDVPGKRFVAAVAGFEYTESSILGSSADLGLLLEYQYDGREKLSRTMLTNTLPTPNNNDIFAGIRFALNDEQNSQVLFGVTIDVDTRATVASFKGSRRVGDNWKIEVESLAFFHVPQTDILIGPSRDDYVQVRLIRFF